MIILNNLIPIKKTDAIDVIHSFSKIVSIANYIIKNRLLLITTACFLLCYNSQFTVMKALQEPLLFGV